MDIRGAIEKATQLPKTNAEASFVWLRKSDQATLDRNMNKKKVKTPRNIKLVEDYSVGSSDKNTNSFNENEIMSSVKVVNGGVSYSNKSFEKHWKSKILNHTSNVQQFNANTSKNKSSSGSSTTVETSTDQENIENNKNSNTIDEVLKQCKLFKNAVILSLLNSNIITLEDLEISEKPSLDNERSRNQSDVRADDNAVTNHLVQHPDEPDVYIHSLQFMETFEKSKGKATDFVIDHIGVKETITPQQYYINKIDDDESLKFVKKNVKDK